MRWSGGAKCFYCHEVADEASKTVVLAAHELILLVCSACWKKVTER